MLFVNANTGASDLTMDPDNPRILLAGTWQYVIHTWGQNSGGPGSGVWMSRDEGATWVRLTNGLPKRPVGKVAVGIGQSDPDVMYALIETGGNGRGSLWRSNDGGASWRVVSYNRMLNDRPHYYTRLLISPDDANEVYFPSNEIWYTLDGGRTVYQTYWAGDNHAMRADPTNANRMMIGSDIGLFISTTHGKSWHHIILPIGQMYHIAVDNRVPYDLYVNMQDDESVRGPSNTRTYGGIPSSDWSTTAGCESGFSFPDTGAIDPLEEIADICEEHKLWFHVDAAHGGFFMLVDGLKPKFKGIERSDSVVVDPHKGMFLPFGIGAVLVRDASGPVASYSHRAPYMQDALGYEEMNPADTGPELSKHFRGLRMWLPLHLHGVSAFKAGLEEKSLLSMYFHLQLVKMGFETGPEPELSVSLFRFPAGDRDEFNRRLLESIRDDGRVLFSSTIIDGEFWISCAILNFRTHVQEVDLALRVLDEKVKALGGKS